MVQIDMRNYTAGREHMTSIAANVTVDVSWYSNQQFAVWLSGNAIFLPDMDISKVEYGNYRNLRWHSIIWQRTAVLNNIALRTASPIV
jgi:hypothetical protein